MSARNYNTIMKVYQAALREHPKGIKSYRWSCQKEQEARFAELLKAAGSENNLAKRSLLDVGCGRGDFYKYLKKRRWPVKYTGVDLLPEFIAKARKLYPEAKFIEKDFLQWQASNQYDYVIASGLLSVKLPDNKKYLQESVRKMLKLARRGAAFNFLTTFRKEKFKRWHYYDPGEVLDWCVSLKTVKRLSLSIGYDPLDRFGDATILLFKKD